MACKIIGLLGSPLARGNTAHLLDCALRGAKDSGCDVEKIAIDHIDFDAAMDVLFCTDPSKCILDTGLKTIYQKFRKADGIIVATPIMTMGVPGRLKSFMDLFQAFFISKYMLKTPLVPADKIGRRRGLFISIAGMDCPTVFDGAKTTTTAFFEILDFKYTDDLLINDMDTIRDLKTRPELLKSAYDKGGTLARDLMKNAM